MANTLNVTRNRRPAEKADAQDDQVLAKLAKLWTSHRKADLEVRWKTGDLLNKRLGLPAGRQPYGQEVLTKASKRLGLSTSELSRMRKFAHHFAGPEDLKERYPKVDSWTKVKGLLPTLDSEKEGAGEQLPPAAQEAGPVHPEEEGAGEQPPPVKSEGAAEGRPLPPGSEEEGAGGAPPPADGESGCFGEFVRCLRTARGKLPDQPIELGEAAQAEVLKALRELDEDARRLFGLPGKIDDV